MRGLVILLSCTSVIFGVSLYFLLFVWVNVQVPFLADRTVTISLLVVPMTECNKRVPIIAGTNIIHRIMPTSTEEVQVPQSWKLAFMSPCNRQVCTVKATSKVVLQPKR